MFVLLCTMHLLTADSELRTFMAVKCTSLILFEGTRDDLKKCSVTHTYLLARRDGNPAHE